MTSDDRTRQQFQKMTETPIPRLVLGLAAPTILSMLITSIYNLADTFFVGQISTSASGAVGVVSSLMAIIQALGFMLGHGSGTIISRSLGSRNADAATRFASTSFFTALAMGAVLGVAGLAALPDFMLLLGSTDTILPHACAYARPILLAGPLMISSFVMNNILRYEGKADLAMIGLVTGGLLNIALDPLFMFGLGLGTAGAGIATALSQSISFGNTKILAIATPGHTRGGMSYYVPKDNLLFTGDTLFAGSIGRTDLPGGDYDQLMESLLDKLIPTVDRDATVLPGHGYSTTIVQELQNNPFLRYE